MLLGWQISKHICKWMTSLKCLGGWPIKSFQLNSNCSSNYVNVAKTGLWNEDAWIFCFGGTYYPDLFFCPLKLFYHKREPNRTFKTVISYVVSCPGATYSKIVLELGQKNVEAESEFVSSKAPKLSLGTLCNIVELVITEQKRIHKSPEVNKLLFLLQK